MDDIEVYSGCDYYTVNEFNSLDCGIDDLVILHQNIRSFSKNYDEFSVFISNLNSSVDVLIFTETWFSNDITHDIDGFIGYHITRDDSRGGGVSIYVRSSLASRINSNASITTEYLECCSIQLKSSKSPNCPALYIVGIYRPPNGSVALFNDCLTELLLENSRGKKRMIICGDINLDILQPNSDCNDVMSSFESYNFLPYITIPTRVTATSSTCLDQLWYNGFNVKQSGCFINDITDHYTQFLILQSSIDKRSCNVSFRDHSERNISLMCDNFHGVLNMYFETRDFLNINEQVELFLDSFWDLYNACCPIKRRNVSANRLIKPWISNTLRDCINNKHKLFRELKKGNIERGMFNAYKNILSKTIKHAKILYYRSKFESCKSDLNSTWKTVNMLIRGKNIVPNISLSVNNLIIDDQKSVANAFCNYFSNVACELDREIPPQITSPLDYMGPISAHTFYANPSSPQEVYNIIMSLTNKNCNVKNIPVFIFKRLANDISIIISDLFNSSVTCGVFPTCFKLARIIPIFKSKDRLLVNNYRPISLTNLVSKLFEKLMICRMFKFVNQNNTLSNQQFGFREGRSTSDAILEFVDECISALDNRRSLVAVYLDFSKAFDTVNHTILLKKMYRLGFRGVILDWVKSFLTDRRIVVDVDGVLSDECVVNIGLPQGAVSSALFFLLYINDMPNISNSINLVQFADDTTIFASGENINHLCEHMSSQLEHVDNYLRANRLSLNINKSCFMIFSHNKVDPNMSIKMRNEDIVFVSKTNFLGVTIDDKLNFTDHVISVRKKLSRSLGIIFKLVNCVPPRIVKQLYYSLFYPHLSYAVTVWGRSSITNINKVTNINVKAIKLVSKVCEPVGLHTNLLSFKSVYSYFTLIKLFNCLNKCNHFYFFNKLNNLIPIHSHETRSSSVIHFNTPHYYKSVSQKFFIYQCVLLWNRLPEEVRNGYCIMKFKRIIKSNLLSEQVNVI